MSISEEICKRKEHILYLKMDDFILKKISQSLDISDFRRHEIISIIGKIMLAYLLTQSKYNMNILYSYTLGFYGKPYFNNVPLYFSISHSKDLVIVALSVSGIGIDVEYMKNIDNKLCNRYYSQEEQAYVKGDNFDKKKFYEIWCSKEAISKFSGIGIWKGMKLYKLQIENNCIVYKNNINDYELRSLLLERNYMVVLYHKMNYSIDLKICNPDKLLKFLENDLEITFKEYIKLL